MNERFKELRDEAFRLTEWETLDYDAILEKFGELIVKECVDVLETEIGRLTEYGNSVDNEDYKSDVDVCITKCIDNIMSIQEHFGIKK